MKHLNANLDNVTNVELKEDSTGQIRILGVDGDNDIVEATLPTTVTGGSVTNFNNNNSIVQGQGFYFDAPNAEFDSRCWRTGTIVTLESTATGHENISITGTITSVEEQLNRATRTFDTLRITVENAQNTAGASDDAFDGGFPDPATGNPVTNTYFAATGSGANYTLEVEPCIIDTSTGVGFDIQSDSSSWYTNSYAANLTTLSGDVSLAPANRRNYRWVFWGWDTNLDGTPVIHPDTGLPSIIVAERSLRNSVRFNTNDVFTPDPTFDPGGHLSTVPGQADMREITGGAPYFDQIADGQPNPATVGYWGANDARGIDFSYGREGSTEVVFSLATGGYKVGMRSGFPRRS